MQLMQQKIEMNNLTYLKQNRRKFKRRNKRNNNNVKIQLQLRMNKLKKIKK